MLAYLARYTDRVAIANSRLLSLDERGVTFRYKDYRRNGRPGIFKTSRLEQLFRDGALGPLQPVAPVYKANGMESGQPPTTRG